MTTTNISAVDVLEDHVGLIKELSEVLARHHALLQFQLLLTPDSFMPEEGAVLVQEVSPDKKSILLRQIPIAELGDSHTIFESQLVDPSDETFTNYATEIHAASCLTRYNLNNECVHIYD